MSSQRPPVDTAFLNPQTPSLLSPLTKRELEVLRLVAEGADNREIAGQLFLTEGTVKWYVKQIYSKMGVRGRTKAVALARELRLLGEEKLPTLSQPVLAKHNLPLQRTRFIGREHDIARVRDRVLHENARLITLVGAPGIGKTRLSLQIASYLTDSFENGVWFVDLAPVRDAELVSSAIVQSLGIQESGGASLESTLRHYLADKHLLLVLDNFEHVLDAAQLIGDLLRNTPRLYMLVTSRTPLSLYDEVEYTVAPLALPDVRHQQPIERLSQCESVALFLQCVRKFRSDFVLDRDNATAVAEICVRLDGLPLAIELAAVRVKMFTPQALLRRLDKPLRLLTEGASDLPPRHRMLISAIQWSYDLLSPGEQMLLSRLGVFVGGWTLEACESVCGDGLSIDPLDGLTSLLNKSLVRQEVAVDGEPRFSQLETIREFALEKLQERGEARKLREAHADYFQSLTLRAEQNWRTPDQQPWFDRLEGEIDNIRAALRWYHAAPDGLEAEMEMIGALGWLWFFRCYFTEALQWTEITLARGGNVAPIIRADVLLSGGYGAFGIGDITKSSEMLEEAFPAYEALGDLREIAFLLGCRAAVKHNQAEAIADYEAVIAQAQALGDEWLVCHTSVNLGAAYLMTGELDRAESVFEAGLELAQKQGLWEDIGFFLENMADLALMRGNIERAKQLCQHYLEAHHRVRSRRLLSSVLNYLGEIALIEARYLEAGSYLAEALELGRALNDSLSIMASLLSQGDLALLTGNPSDALGKHREGFLYAAEMQTPDMTARALEHCATSIAATGEKAKAILLFAAADSLRKAEKTPAPPLYLERNTATLAGIRQVLDERAFDTAWQEGEAMKWEAAVAYALADSDTSQKNLPAGG